MDDWIHRAKLTERAVTLNPGNIFVGLFEFFQNQSHQMKADIDSGLLPWWTSDTLKISFFRPLTEVSHFLDYYFWPNYPFLMHLHNLLWYGLILFLLSLYYKRIMGHSWGAAFALLLFALDSAHSVPVAWIANRNALLATFFCLGALLFHDRWCRDGFKPGRVLGPIFFVCSLLSAEFGLGVCGYLFAYALFIDTRNNRSRVLSLMPYGVITVIWWVFYKFSGFGAINSGIYIDPGSEPFRFLAAFIERLPILLHGQIGLFGADLYIMLPPNFSKVFWSITVLILGLLCIFLLPLLKSDRVACFWGMGMILSLFPVVATMPSNRLLLLAGIGGMGLLSRFFYAWFEIKGLYGGTKVYRLFGGILIFLLLIVHLIIAPIYKVKDAEYFKVLRPVIDQPAADPILVPDHQNQMVIILNPPMGSLFFCYMVCQIYNQSDLNTPYIQLASGESLLKVDRRSEYSLEIFSERGYYSGIWDTLFRNPEHIMPEGSKVKVNGIQMTVLSLTEENLPQKVRFEFDRPLEDADYKFLYWNYDHYETFSLPDVGQTKSMERFNILEFLSFR